jgi:predicted dehydrogenase
MKKIKLGMIGCGFIRPQHMSGLFDEAPDVEVVAACDLMPDRLKAFCERYGARGYKSPVDLFKKSGVDAVSIAIKPEEAKVHLSMEAMALGIHVLAEKPMALTVREARDMAATCRRTGQVLQIAFNRRFELMYQKAVAIIQDRKMFGEVANVTAVFESPGSYPYVTFMSQAPHTFDLLQYLAGRVSSIRSVTRRVFDLALFKQQQKALGHPSEVAYNSKEQGLVGINVACTLKFGSGAVGTLQYVTGASAGALTGDRFEILGTKQRTVVLEGMDRMRVIEKDGVEQCLTSSSWCRKVSSYGLEYCHFADCIRGARPTVLKLDDAVSSVCLYEAFLKSLHTEESVAVDAVK